MLFIYRICNEGVCVRGKGLEEAIFFYTAFAKGWALAILFRRLYTLLEVILLRSTS